MDFPFNSQFGIQFYRKADLLLDLGFSSSESLLTTFDTLVLLFVRYIVIK